MRHLVPIATIGTIASPVICDRITTINVGSVTGGATHGFGRAGAVKVSGLVKSIGPVVGSVDPRQRRKYRSLVLAVPPTPGTADWQSRQHVQHRTHAPP